MLNTAQQGITSLLEQDSQQHSSQAGHAAVATQCHSAQLNRTQHVLNTSQHMLELRASHQWWSRTLNTTHHRLGMQL